MNSSKASNDTRAPQSKKPAWAKTVVWLVLVVSLISGTVYGGSGWFNAVREENFHRALARMKDSSMREKGDELIAGENAVDYLAKRTFFVIDFGGLEILDDLDEVTVHFIPNASKRFPYGTFELNGRDEAQSSDESGENTSNSGNPKISIQHGSAAAITSDGYFLTNAHVIDNVDVPVYLWGPAEKGMSLKRARVVWRGDYGHFDLPDMVLLHADLKPAGYFPLGDGELPDVGELLFTGGFGGLTPGQSAGEMVLHGIRRKWDGEVRWRALIHDAAILPGDSGGPVTSRKGELVGINARMHPDSHWSRDGHKGFKARALHPYGDWLVDLIDVDRAARESQELSDSASLRDH